MFNFLFPRKPSVPETTVADAAKAHAVGSAQIVDVREKDEWSDGHIPQAIHIPLGSLAASVATLDASRPVIVVCRSGRRSLHGAEILIKSGFSNVASMAGGMNDWTTAGHPVKH